MWSTSECVNRWCQTKKAEKDSSKQTVKMLTTQLANINTDNSDDEVSSPSKYDTMKAFRSTFKNLVNKDPKAKGKDEFASKLLSIKNLILKKKTEAIEYEKECMRADKYF